MVSLQLPATDPDLPVDALTWSAIGLPDGLAMNPLNGEISGTVARPGHIATTCSVGVSVFDGVGGSDSVTFSWLVIPTNLEPVANQDRFAVDQGEQLVVSAPGLLSNDSDPESQSLIVGFVPSPLHGSLSLSTDGSFAYTNDGVTDADDCFSYRIFDGYGGFDVAIVSIEVIKVNAAPQSGDDSVFLDEDTFLGFDPFTNDTDPDGDPLAIESFEQPSGGALRINGNGGLLFTPDPNFHGVFNVSYTATDGRGGSDTATIKLTVYPVNDAPIGSPDSVVLIDYLTASIPVLSNDTDPDGDVLSIASVVGEGIGEIDVHGDQITFKPPSGWTGTTTLRYSVVDPFGAIDSVEVLVEVTHRTLVVAKSLLEDIEASTKALASFTDSFDTEAVDLTPVEIISLMVTAFYQTINAFTLHLVFLGVSMVVLVGFGSATKIPLLFAGRNRTHWSVVLLDRETPLRVFEEPNSETPVIYNFNSSMESLLSTGREVTVSEAGWMPIRTQRGNGWAESFYLTEQVDVTEFAKDQRPVKLAVEFAEILRNGGDVTSLIADRGIILALTGPPAQLGQRQFTELLDGRRLRRLHAVDGVLQDQDDFRIAGPSPSCRV